MNEARVKRDGEKINRTTKKYDGNESAHFEMLYDSKGGSFLSIGGRTDAIGAKLAEIMVRLIASGAANESYIDEVADFAKKALKNNGPVQ